MDTLQHKIESPVRIAEGMGERGEVRPVPDHLNMKKVFEQPELYLFNPFIGGLSVKKVLPQSLRYSDLRNAFLVEPEDVSTMVHERNNQMIQLFSVLGRAADEFFNVAVAMYHRQLMIPKRDASRRPHIEQDEMGLIVSPPKRKLQGPKLTAKPTRGR